MMAADAAALRGCALAAAAAAARPAVRRRGAASCFLFARRSRRLSATAAAARQDGELALEHEEYQHQLLLRCSPEFFAPAEEPACCRLVVGVRPCIMRRSSSWCLLLLARIPT